MRYVALVCIVPFPAFSPVRSLERRLEGGVEVEDEMCFNCIRINVYYSEDIRLVYGVVFRTYTTTR